MKIQTIKRKYCTENLLLGGVNFHQKVRYIYLYLPNNFHLKIISFWATLPNFEEKGRIKVLFFLHKLLTKAGPSPVTKSSKYEGSTIQIFRLTGGLHTYDAMSYVSIAGIPKPH